MSSAHCVILTRTFFKFLVRVFKGGLIPKSMYFHFGPILEKMCKVTTLNFLTESEKVKDSDFSHFFEDGTKLKIPSDIKPPFEILNKNEKQIPIFEFSSYYNIRYIIYMDNIKHATI